MSDQRKYIRHPTEIPIEYKIIGDLQEHTDSTNNVSLGGICFQAVTPIPPGTEISIKFPSVNSSVVLTGRVVWCTEKGKYADIGVKFQNKTDALLAKTLEEICYIRKFEKSYPQNSL
jgi:Tfp pilus assembly protein PilZ